MSSMNIRGCADGETSAEDVPACGPTSTSRLPVRKLTKRPPEVDGESVSKRQRLDGMLHADGVGKGQQQQRSLSTMSLYRPSAATRPAKVFSAITSRHTSAPQQVKAAVPPRHSAGQLARASRARPPAGAPSTTAARDKKSLVAASAATSAAPKAAASGTARKLPAWDIKGRLGLMEANWSQDQARIKMLEQMVGELEGVRVLRERETSVSSEQVSRLQSELSKTETELGPLRRQVQELTEELSAAARARQRAERDLEARDAENAELRRSVAEASALRLAMTTQIDVAECRLRERESALREAGEREAALGAEVATLSASIEEQGRTLQKYETERRYLHNLVQELKGNIRVFCRVRPLLGNEVTKSAEHICFPSMDDSGIALVKQEESHTGRGESKPLRYEFSFDKVFQPSCSQGDVFQEISQLVQSALDGYNVSIFAYGQTGSGKTFTMEGPDEADFSPHTEGVIPRAVKQIFSAARQLEPKGWNYTFRASFIEIYNENLRDLLAGPRTGKSQPLEIKQAPLKGSGGSAAAAATTAQLTVTNLLYTPVTTEAELERLLLIAKGNRSVASTAANNRSSRSHSVFQLHIRGSNDVTGQQFTSQLNLVDLAGSERLDKSQSTGERLKEAQHINSSLTSLALVIMALSNKEQHIPYRNSKLTYLLQNCLGGNSKTLMFINLSPSEDNFSETLNSLRFATKVNECVIGTAQANRT
ncbi:kinesin-like protein KIFC1 [Lethenteron reissneri]|uniref:kinesin-like protein KIFC1 n=1 Tax=Lethenteron reissneri TaxID=7753 RepID=UPI002AB67523|nr:kinesin-like protein KIFC1 [Lethenteron reissneri]